MKLNIRAMTLGDLEDILAIEKQSFSTPWSYEAFYKEITENKFAIYYVATYGDKIIGYSGMWLVIDESHITNIAIIPDYRGKGIAKMLMYSMMVTSVKNSCNRMTLEVRVENYPAQYLYHGLGFVNAGIRKGYYSDTGDDAIIMWNYNLSKTLKGLGNSDE